MPELCYNFIYDIAIPTKVLRKRMLRVFYAR